MKPIVQLLAPCGIYRRKPVTAFKAFVTRQESRFAATQTAKGATWEITHRRSGAAVTSAAGYAIKKRSDALAMIALLEASAFDFAPFDRLPQVTEGTAGRPDFPEADRPAVRPFIDLMRGISRQVMAA